LSGGHNRYRFHSWQLVKHPPFGLNAAAGLRLQTTNAYDFGESLKRSLPDVGAFSFWGLTMLIRSLALLAAVGLLAGCADNGSLIGGNNLTTSSVAPTPTVDPACSPLSTQIAGLRQEGIGDKIEKAAAKKYKMTPADLAKADQLTKASAEFQAKCSTLPRAAAVGASPAAPAAAGAATAAPAKTSSAGVAAAKVAANAETAATTVAKP
jgi:hypothetical protein